MEPGNLFPNSLNPLQTLVQLTSTDLVRQQNRIITKHTLENMKDALTDADVGYRAFGGKTDSVKVKNAWSNLPLPQKSSWFCTQLTTGICMGVL
jgi:hypothetical protein